MYGWLCGIIFSKLAFSTSLVAAKKPSTTVITAHTTSTSRRLLNTSRSSRLPDFRSKSARSRTTGICSRSSEAAPWSFLRGFGLGASARRPSRRARPPARASVRLRRRCRRACIGGAQAATASSVLPPSRGGDDAPADVGQRDRAAGNVTPADDRRRQADVRPWSSSCPRPRCDRRCRASRTRAPRWRCR